MTDKTRVILVGIGNVGGPTCSGKTTLAKHLNRILPNSVIIHQDDFAPPQEMVPIHPVHKVQDWDAPAGAIEWPRLITFLRKVKETGELPPDHRSHDHLNEQKNIPISRELQSKWTQRFRHIEESRVDDRKERISFGLVDGFLLYWHPEVLELLDARIFLRVPHDILKQRRHERHGYHTAVQSDPEGNLWRDPPHYWEQIVYPAYLEAHVSMFVDKNVEHGELLDPSKFHLIEPLSKSMDETVDESCELLENVIHEHSLE